MKKKWKLILLLIISFGVNSAIAQESINASGGDASGSGGTVAFSVGLVTYSHESSADGNINQGVQQPYETYLVSINEEQWSVEVYAFPNPTSDNLNIQFEGIEYYNATISLTDYTGKVLFKLPISSTSTTLNLSNYLSGVYMLHITAESKIIKTFKIIKN